MSERSLGGACHLQLRSTLSCEIYFRATLVFGAARFCQMQRSNKQTESSISCRHSNSFASAILSSCADLRRLPSRRRVLFLFLLGVRLSPLCHRLLVVRLQLGSRRLILVLLWGTSSDTREQMKLRPWDSSTSMRIHVCSSLSARADSWGRSWPTAHRLPSRYPSSAGSYRTPAPHEPKPRTAGRPTAASSACPTRLRKGREDKQQQKVNHRWAADVSADPPPHGASQCLLVS